MKKNFEQNFRGRQAHYVLKDTSLDLSGKDLLRIIEMAEKAHASVHVSHGTHQIFIGVPIPYRSFIDRTMKTIGFRYAKKSERLLENSSFPLDREHHALEM